MRSEKSVFVRVETSSMMIRLTLDNGTRAIELFGENEAYQLMGERHL